jgi:hypothetical protein
LLAPKTVPSSQSLLDRAGRWFLESGIQESTGGVARYYLSDSRRNARVSTEITGYAASVLAWLHGQTGEPAYLDAALCAGRYLVHHAWDESSATFPFEPVLNGEPAFSYFFDCGIIVRGLLALWRATGEGEFLERATEAGIAMAFDFFADEAVHPIIGLPDKQPLAYQPRWSRSPGCYQLKSAMAWHDLARVTGQSEITAAYERMLAYSLATHDRFFAVEESQEKIMDRLHAYCYFLEGLLPAAGRPECAYALAAGIQRAASYLRDIAPVFVRSDVFAQLLRVRLYAHHLGAVPLDFDAAAGEARLAAEFQSMDDDPALSGGFWFGRKDGQLLPFMNPVSTAFCAQSLIMWQQFQEGALSTPVTALV